MFLLQVVLVAMLASFAAPLAAQNTKSPKDETETIRRMLTELNKNGEFTGSVLVAQADKVVYREAIASKPGEARALLTSPSNIASLAKGFTAMAIMMLAERGKLGYDDPIERHVAELAGAAPGITIRHLLTHTSGIPDEARLPIPLQQYGLYASRDGSRESIRRVF